MSPISAVFRSLFSALADVQSPKSARSPRYESTGYGKIATGSFFEHWYGSRQYRTNMARRVRAIDLQALSRVRSGGCSAHQAPLAVFADATSIPDDGRKPPASAVTSASASAPSATFVGPDCSAQSRRPFAPRVSKACPSCSTPGQLRASHHGRPAGRRVTGSIRSRCRRDACGNSQAEPRRRGLRAVSDRKPISSAIRPRAAYECEREVGN